MTAEMRQENQARKIDKSRLSATGTSHVTYRLTRIERIAAWWTLLYVLNDISGCNESE